MWTWVEELVKTDRGATPGNALIKWYAHDVVDGERLSQKAQQDGLRDEELAGIWQKKHWSLVKEKLLAQEKMSYTESRDIKSYEDLKAWCEGKRVVNQPIITPPELGNGATVEIPEKKVATIEKVKEHLATPLPPIDMSKVNVISSKNVVSRKKSNLGKKIAEKVAEQL